MNSMVVDAQALRARGTSRGGFVGRSPRAPSNQRGITLIELLIVVAVAAVLAAVALPNMSEFIKNNARSTRLNDLSTAINFSRSMAVTQRRQSRFCASVDGTTCSGLLQFGAGLVVMVRSPIVPLPAPPNDWDLVRSFPGTVAPNFAITGTASQIIYEATGLPAASVANTTFTHCDSRGPSSARAIILSSTGHPSISRDTDADGIHDINGVALTCPAF